MVSLLKSVVRRLIPARAGAGGSGGAGNNNGGAHGGLLGRDQGNGAADGGSLHGAGLVQIVAGYDHTSVHEALLFPNPEEAVALLPGQEIVCLHDIRHDGVTVCRERGQDAQGSQLVICSNPSYYNPPESTSPQGKRLVCKHPNICVKEKREETTLRSDCR